ncbi:MAG: hypothetical protein BIFFINMI_00989 [Phycisphaerae bacterium]|nr:hypothetical protein [Phycisphaerae bacterium]
MVQRRSTASAAVLCSALLALAALGGGCGLLTERSYPMDTATVARITRPGTAAMNTRHWLDHASAELMPLLPAGDRKALLTEQLSGVGAKPVDPYRFFGRNPAFQSSIIVNFNGIQATSRASAGELTEQTRDAAWPGFEDIWIPINDRLSLSGRLGLCRNADGTVRDTDCLIILPGLWGSNATIRTRDIAAGLRALGHHVMALEFRGYGRTWRQYPDIDYGWGVMDSYDLMAVDDWLTSRPHITATGLIGYCYGANHALLAAWSDARGNRPHAGVTPELEACLPRLPQRRRFTAGIMAISPVLEFEKFLNELDQPRPLLLYPTLHVLQSQVKEQQELHHFEHPDGQLRRLIVNIGFEFPGYFPAGLRFLRLIPYDGQPACDKLAEVRVPLLIVHASNDPLCDPATIRTLLDGVSNPNVAAVMVDGGGHVGFTVYEARWFYSLVVNFFDPTVGAAAVQTPAGSPAIAGQPQPQAAEESNH